MPIETIQGTDLRYHLISLDADGNERAGDPDGVMFDRVLAGLANEKPTDVFVFIHGWKGDLPAARQQYAAWMSTLMQQAGDLALAKARWPGFKPMLIGLHWPSLPFGNESFGQPASFGVDGDPAGTAVDEIAQQFGDTPAARAALRTILEAASDIAFTPAVLPPDVADAYRVLDRESGLGADGVGADPGGDREPFDPDVAFRLGSGGVAVFGSGGARRALLSPLVQLSFWKMKDRARRIGETGGFRLLDALMRADPDVRLHLMGHSFGCIASAASVCGSAGRRLPRGVASMVLVQGALSLWSCSAKLPGSDKAGYFRRLAAGDAVLGPIVTTRSRHDTAVGSLYPMAAGVARQVAFTVDDLPKYGGVGAFGLRGTGLAIEDVVAGPIDTSYAFHAGRIYNVNCDQVIREGGPPSGAHSDIARPEVGHLVWSAALAVGVTTPGAV